MLPTSKRKRLGWLANEEKTNFSAISVLFSHLPIISIPKAILAGALEECASIFRQATNYQQSLLNSLVTKATEMMILFLWEILHFPSLLLLISAGQDTGVDSEQGETQRCIIYQLPWVPLLSPADHSFTVMEMRYRLGCSGRCQGANNERDNELLGKRISPVSGTVLGILHLFHLLHLSLHGLSLTFG